MARRRIALRVLVVAGLGLALGLVLLVAPRASTAPDGLERVAAQHDIGHATPRAATSRRPGALAGLPTGVAGVVGVVVVFAAATGAVAVVRRARS